MNKQFNGLNTLRALAILLVINFHYYFLFKDAPQWVTTMFKIGWSGVDMFFVLSGFLISSILFKEIINGHRISLKKFYINRFFRIIPAFIFVVLLYFLFPILHERKGIAPLWKFLTFTLNFGLDYLHKGTFSHAWSLCVEEHFYLIFPLFLFFLQSIQKFKYSYWFLILLFCGGFFIRYFIYTDIVLPNSTIETYNINFIKYIYYPTYNRLDGLLVGVSISALYNFLPNVWKKVSNYGNLILILSIISLIFSFKICHDLTAFRTGFIGYPLLAFSFGLLVIAALSPQTFLFKWNSKIFTYIASISYSLYLIHKIAFHYTRYLLQNVLSQPNLIFIISLLVSFIAASLMYYFIEQPFLKLRTRVINTLVFRS